LSRLPDHRLDTDDQLAGIRVSRSCTIQVRTNTYSVPSQLIGQKVDVRIGAEALTVSYQGHIVQTMPRLFGKKGVSINYRHVIDSLVRKPGAFENYRYHQEMFPTSQFRIAYDILSENHHSAKVADKTYIQILQIAARESQDAVDGVLRMMIASEEPIDLDKIRQRVQDTSQTPGHPPSVEIEPVNLAKAETMATQTQQLTDQFRELRLPSFREHFQEAAQRATTENLSHVDYLWELTTLECEVRRVGRIKRLMTRSKLPLGKTWDSFDFSRLPLAVRRQLQTLRDGSFLQRRENVLIFGKPGSGKSHALCALAEQLIQQGHSMLFTTCSLLVQQLLIAKRDLRLPRLIKQYSKFDGLIIDDLGYVQQSREEMEVLFTLLAERYERGSVLLTSNLAFSKWDQIFKDAMTTAAAIDRLVHHSVIIELNIPSYRVETAKKAKQTSKTKKK